MTGNHEYANARLSEGVDDGGCLRFQAILHHKQPEEDEVEFELIPLFSLDARVCRRVFQFAPGQCDYSIATLRVVVQY